MNRQNRIQVKGCCFLALLMSFLMLFPAGNVKAQVTEAVSGVNIYDDADLLTSEEENDLQDYLEKMSEKAGIEIYVLTSEDSGYGAYDRYIEDFYDAGFANDTIEENAVFMHIDLDIDMEERYVNIQAYGPSRKRITDQTGDAIIDYIVKDLKDGDYEWAARGFADEVERYMNYVPIYKRVWFQLLVAVVIGAISVAIMAASSGGKMTAGASKYQDSKYSGIRARRDDYIRTSVTKRRKPQSTSSGGGGGHRSSGGHSHSSAGRHF